jgi:thiamine kinase-like enzyme
MMTSDDARLDLVPALAGRPRTVETLTGGLTNRNLKVTVDRARYVVRLSGESGSLLPIDREAEYTNSVRAATTGVAPEVIHYLPGEGVLVIAWIEGRTFTEADVRDPANLPRIAAACRTLHNGPRFAGDFDMFSVQRQYLGIVQANGFRLPDRYLDFLPQVERIQASFAAHPQPSVPCNNDLLAANFIDSGDQLWLIDYEYSGNNDACFELGNIWSESVLDDELLAELVTHYVGRPSPSRTARARLWAVVAKYGWMLWASIQDGSSDLDFDFWSWGMEKYDRAVGEFDDPRFATWLEEIARPD